MAYDPSYSQQQIGPAGSFGGGGGGAGGNILSLVYYRDQKDAKDAADTAADAFAALTFTTTPTSLALDAIRDAQDDVNKEVVKFLTAMTNQSLITSLMAAQGDPQSATLAAVLLVR